VHQGCAQSTVPRLVTKSGACQALLMELLKAITKGPTAALGLEPA
jgi:hypothetical protein